jgi:hypothetical protein
MVFIKTPIFKSTGNCHMPSIVKNAGREREGSKIRRRCSLPSTRDEMAQRRPPDPRELHDYQVVHASISGEN